MRNIVTVAGDHDPSYDSETWYLKFILDLNGENRWNICKDSRV